LTEGIKNNRQHLRSNANTGVADAKLNPLIAHIDLDGDTAMFGELYSVAEQVAKYELQFRAVRIERWQG
jgi:hypothetical protein